MVTVNIYHHRKVYTEQAIINASKDDVSYSEIGKSFLIYEHFVFAAIFNKNEERVM
jgi:hypothetical protein